jgi:surface-anchored protein
MRAGTCFLTFCLLVLAGTARSAAPIYSEGHADIGVRFSNGVLEIGYNFLGATIDGAIVSQFVPMSNVALLVPDSTLEPRPDNVPGLLNFDPIGVAAGVSTYRLSSSGTEATITGSPYLGFGTYLLNSADFSGPVTFQLTGFTSQAGGVFSLYQDSFPGPTFRVTTANGVGPADSFPMSLNAHDHFNWVFTTDGLYSMEWTATVTHKTLGPLRASGSMNVGVLTTIPEASTLLLSSLVVLWPVARWVYLQRVSR